MRPLSEFDRNHPHGHVQENGRPARIIGEIDNPDYPLVVVCTMESGRECVKQYSVGGRIILGSVDRAGRDLVNAPAPKKRVQGWVNVYRGGLTSDLRASRDEADQLARPVRIACVFIDVEEGEGLS